MTGIVFLDKGLLTPERIAIREDGATWTYAHLGERVNAVASYLRHSLDSVAGERIAVFADPSPEMAAVLLGAMQAGAIAVPVSTQATAPEINYLLSDADVVAAIGSTADASRFAAAEPSTHVRFIDRIGLPTKASEAIEAPPDGQPVLMLYTSGTTGRPKGVLHTYGSLKAQVSVLHEAWRWAPTNELLHVLPLHHIHGLVNGLLGALWAGAGLELARFRPAETWEAFADGRISVFYAVPTIYYQLVEAWEKQDTSTQQRWSEGAARLRLAVCGSAALPAPLWQRWQQITGTPLLERYGMTEIGMALSNPYEAERRPGTVGQALPGVEVKLVDEDGMETEQGQPGEIWVKGPTLFREYWRRPDATAEAFRDGYFMTGDIAEVQDGYYRILGRASTDIIKSAAYKLSALEIEEVLLAHPNIAEVAVIGMPDEQWGEVVTACVVLRDGSSLTLTELRAWCDERLSVYKHPRRLEAMESLPRNALGKVMKPELQKLLAEP